MRKLSDQAGTKTPQSNLSLFILNTSPVSLHFSLLKAQEEAIWTLDIYCYTFAIMSFFSSSRPTLPPIRDVFPGH
jgi:hypothetical protein